MKRGLPEGGQDPSSILVILPTWVGDFVMATPALRAIRRRFPKTHITFLVEPNLLDLVRGGDWMDECVAWPEKYRRTPFHQAFWSVAWGLRRRHFDWAVLLPNSFRSGLVARIIGARRRIGFDRDGRGFLLTDRIAVPNRARDAKSSVAAWKFGGPRERPASREPIPPAAQKITKLDGVRFDPHAPVVMGAQLPVSAGRYVPYPMVAYYADLVEILACDRPGDRLELFTNPVADAAVESRLISAGIADRKPLVVISPGAKYGSAKCWAPERFAEAVDRLMVLDHAAAVVTCGPGEETIARRIAECMESRGQVWDRPRLSLDELKSLIRRCDLLLCNDAGPRHFAKAFDVPVVAIFGPTHPQWTATSYKNERIVRVDVDCGPCQQRACPLGHTKCMTDVTVEMVVEAARDLLSRRMEAAVGWPVALAVRQTND